VKIYVGMFRTFAEAVRARDAAEAEQRAAIAAS
jgi:hypothetical protein